MTLQQTPDRQSVFAEALKHIECAIELLDGAEAPVHIAAHLDLALHQLGDVIASQSAAESMHSLFTD